MINSIKQRFSHCFRALAVGVIVAWKYVREKEEFEDEKQDEQFYQNQQPQLFADGHWPESVDIKHHDATEQAPLSVSSSGTVYIRLMASHDIDNNCQSQKYATSKAKLHIIFATIEINLSVL